MTERAPGMQSVGRAFRVLELLADAGGVATLTSLADESALPLSSIHRVMGTLVELGYVRRAPGRRYALAPRLIRLGEASAAGIGVWARPLLRRLADELDESANVAMLDGAEIVYVDQASSRRSIRMFTEPGRRVPPHCTAVGKAMMARMPEPEVRAILERTGMPSSTAATITDPDRFVAELEQVRRRGYALDDGEQEEGIRCVATAVPLDAPRLAISFSGPTGRISDDLLRRAVPLLHDACAALACELDPAPAT